VVGALLGDIAGTLDAAAEAGALDPGPALDRTLALWALLQGSLSLEKIRRIEPSLPAPDHVALAALDALLRGWGADPRAIARAAELAARASSSAAPRPSRTSRSKTTHHGRETRT
jgi:hypothetical protein